MGWTPQESQEGADFDRDLRAVLADTSLNVRTHRVRDRRRVSEHPRRRFRRHDHRAGSPGRDRAHLRGRGRLPRGRRRARRPLADPPRGHTPGVRARERLASRGAGVGARERPRAPRVRGGRPARPRARLALRDRFVGVPRADQTGAGARESRQRRAPLEYGRPGSGRLEGEVPGLGETCEDLQAAVQALDCGGPRRRHRARLRRRRLLGQVRGRAGRPRLRPPRPPCYLEEQGVPFEHDDFHSIARRLAPEPFDFGLSTERYRAFGPDTANLWHEEGLYRVLDGREVRIEPASVGFASPRVRPRWQGLVRRYLGEPFDLDAFAAFAATEPVLAGIVPALRGFRPPLVPDPFETLVTSITAQQISSVPRSVSGIALIRTFGERPDITYAFRARSAWRAPPRKDRRRRLLAAKSGVRGRARARRARSRRARPPPGRGRQSSSRRTAGNRRVDQRIGSSRVTSGRPGAGRSANSHLEGGLHHGEGLDVRAAGARFRALPTWRRTISWSVIGSTADMAYEAHVEGAPTEGVVRRLIEEARAAGADVVEIETTHEDGEAWIRAGFTETARVLQARWTRSTGISAPRGSLVRLHPRPNRRRRCHCQGGAPVRAAASGRLAGKRGASAARRVDVCLRRAHRPGAGDAPPPRA